MPNVLNTQFMADPLAFIGDANHAVGGHDDLFQAMAGTRVTTLAYGSEGYKTAAKFVEAADAFGLISFDLVKYKHGTRKMLVLRPVVDATLFKAKIANLQALARPFASAPSNPIRGYWFPYKVPTSEEMAAAKKYGGSGPPGIMGYVDFEMNNPRYPFVFTGSMQGCHIVVTLSPTNPLTHFRAYHYASPGNFRGLAGDMAYICWPASIAGRVCAWLDDSQYGADPEHDAVDAFNFLHYRNNSWRIYTQKQKRTLVISGKSAVILFEVMDTAVSEPITNQPIPNGDLIDLYKAWERRCKEWAAFRFGKKVDYTRVIDGR